MTKRLPDTVKVINRAIRHLKRGWCKSQMAIDKYGNGVGANSPKACAWCALGAIMKAENDLNVHVYKNIIKLKGVDSITHINDKAKDVDEVIGYFARWRDLCKE